MNSPDDIREQHRVETTTEEETVTPAPLVEQTVEKTSTETETVTETPVAAPETPSE